MVVAEVERVVSRLIEGVVCSGRQRIPARRGSAQGIERKRLGIAPDYEVGAARERAAVEEALVPHARQRHAVVAAVPAAQTAVERVNPAADELRRVGPKGDRLRPLRRGVVDVDVDHIAPDPVGIDADPVARAVGKIGVGRVRGSELGIVALDPAALVDDVDRDVAGRDLIRVVAPGAGVGKGTFDPGVIGGELAPLLGGQHRIGVEGGEAGAPVETGEVRPGAGRRENAVEHVAHVERLDVEGIQPDIEGDRGHAPVGPHDDPGESRAGVAVGDRKEGGDVQRVGEIELEIGKQECRSEAGNDGAVAGRGSAEGRTGKDHDGDRDGEQTKSVHESSLPGWWLSG